MISELQKNLDPVMIEKYQKWIDRKTKNKPTPISAMMYRTQASAFSIISEVSKIPFDKLKASIYFYCQSIQALEFTQKYEAQLELAATHPEQFIEGLHKFFNLMARYVKENDLYDAFFELVAICERMRLPVIGDRNSDPITMSVADSYQNLLLQNLEYMRPNKFDLSVVVCGKSTTGELLTLPDIYPTIDEVYREWTSITDPLIDKGKLTKTQHYQMLADIALAHGYHDLRTEQDIERIHNIDNLYNHHHTAMLPYINEYTYDILVNPEHPYDGSITPFLGLRVRGIEADELVSILNKRTLALPVNGMQVDFSYGGEKNVKKMMTSCFMREVIHNDHVTMLYKLSLNEMELCGYYDTADGFLYSVLQEAKDRVLFQRIRLFLMYVYASAVTEVGLLESAEEHLFIAAPEDSPYRNVKVPIRLELHPKGACQKLMPDADGLLERLGPADDRQAMHQASATYPFFFGFKGLRAKIHSLGNLKTFDVAVPNPEYGMGQNN